MVHANSQAIEITQVSLIGLREPAQKGGFQK